MPTLSICIPTFNRAACLRALLEDIRLQITELQAGHAVSVVVSDNHSEDETEHVVAAARGAGLPVTYHRQPRNVGFAANMNHVVARAPAAYCWLMGSDERLRPGALRRVLEALNGDPSVDVLVANKAVGGLERRYLVDSSASDTFAIEGAADLLAYVRRCAEVSALFAFISTLVVRKAAWDSVAITEDEAGHAYTHCIRLFHVLLRGGRVVRHIEFALVDAGTVANEYSSAVFRHAILDARTLEYLAGLFEDRVAARAAFAVVFRRQYSNVVVLAAKAHATGADWKAITPLLVAAGYPAFAITRSPLDPVLRLAYRVARALKRALASAVGSRNTSAVPARRATP